MSRVVFTFKFQVYRFHRPTRQSELCSSTHLGASQRTGISNYIAYILAMTVTCVEERERERERKTKAGNHNSVQICSAAYALFIQYFLYMSYIQSTSWALFAPLQQCDQVGKKQR